MVYYILYNMYMRVFNFFTYFLIVLGSKKIRPFNDLRRNLNADTCRNVLRDQTEHVTKNLVGFNKQVG